ncbi:ribokinase [Harryflintia acetispora]|uniref:ribokinase n=1 Tax=Harryflintia acetispora TaxID=1849041 RepID=UPI00189B31D2|nr:ribokinase [Harryflintia acetispora]
MIAVIGSINMDVVLRVERAPSAGQNIYVESTGLVCGGKGANAAIALSRLGEEVAFCGCVGADDNGMRLLENLKQEGVDISPVIVREGIDSGTAYILLERDGANRIVVAPGANETLKAEDMHRYALPLIRRSELVLINLEMSMTCINEIVQLCRQEHKCLVIDAGPVRGVRPEQLAGAYCVSPNETELEALAGRPLNGMDEVRRAAGELLDLGIERVLIKLGGRGCCMVSRQESYILPAYEVRVVDTTAAGDSFMAGFCSALAVGLEEREAVRRANMCGAVAVTRTGAAPSLPCRKDIEMFDAFLLSHKKEVVG